MKFTALIPVLSVMLSTFVYTHTAAQTVLQTSSLLGSAAGNRQKQASYPKNVVKMNLSSLAFKNYSFTYERLIARKISVSAGYRFMPKTQLSQLKASEYIMDIAEDGFLTENLENISAGNNTITAEVRFYTGRKPGAKGFYVGLYGRTASFDIDYLHEYETAGNTYRIPIQSSSRGLGGGLLLGTQFTIAKRVVFDIYILGGHYGKLKGDFTGNANLSSMTKQEQMNLQADLNNLITIDQKPVLETQVTSSGVAGTVKAPFAGIRGLGLSVGFTL